MMAVSPVGLFLFSAFACVSHGIPLYTVTVNTSVTTGPLNHFWKSTGFCPPDPHNQSYDFDYGRDMIQNLAFIGAVPHGGIEQVRIHWLLDLVTVISVTGGVPTYDFSQLDDVIALLFKFGLKPGFEIMGNPSSLFNDFDNKTQVYMWKDLVTKTAENYIAQYGLGWVSEWNFETWNEPDCRDFDDITITVQGFLNYYDACSEGLKAASPLLKLGGPGDGCRHTVYSDAFLNHVVNGPNYFTGENVVRLDFLSYHEKGDNSSAIIRNKEEDLMTDIVNKYPSLATKPFYNDEADPLVGWSKSMWWRADGNYAAMVAKIIAQHQNMIIQNPSSPIKNYTLLSNDNAFLSWWPNEFTQRTLLARFQMNISRDQHSQLFRKPVYAVMGLLALLGETQIYTSVTSPSLPAPWPLDADFGMIASIHTPEMSSTADSWQMALIVYFSNDTGGQLEYQEANFTLDIRPPGNTTDLMLVTWMVDNWYGSPYAPYQQLGRPMWPKLEETQQMRRNEGASFMPFYSYSVTPGIVSLGKILFNTPSVMLFHVCAKSVSRPDQVNGLNILNITQGQVLITWSDSCINSKCILTYDVEYSSKSADGPYTKISSDDKYSIDTVLVYQPLSAKDLPDPDVMVNGYYRVRAVDYWKQSGDFSIPQVYPDTGAFTSTRRKNVNI